MKQTPAVHPTRRHTREIQEEADEKLVCLSLLQMKRRLVELPFGGFSLELLIQGVG